MDYYERVATLRNKLLQDRRALIVAAVLVVLFSTSTLIAGIVVIKHAVQDDRASAHAGNTPTQVGLLLEDRPSELLNHIVFFNDVRLEPGPSGDVYFAGSKDGDNVLVLSAGRKSASALNADSVDVQGTIRPAPPLSTLTKKWKLTKDQAKAVQKQGIYVEAESISVKRNQPERLARK